MLELYHGATSVCAAKVRLVLEHKGMAYVSHLLDLAKNEQNEPVYLKLNPNGVVPTLVHDGFIVIESTLINEYLEDISPEPSLLPQTAAGRVKMRSWTKRLDEGLHNAVSMLSFAVVLRHMRPQPGTAEYALYLAGIASPERRTMLDAAMRLGPEAPQAKAAVQLYRKALAAMEADLQTSPWLAGPDYSLADAALAPYVHRLAMLELSGLWDALPGRTKSQSNFERAVVAFISAPALQMYRERGREARDLLLAG